MQLLLIVHHDVGEEEKRGPQYSAKGKETISSEHVKGKNMLNLRMPINKQKHTQSIKSSFDLTTHTRLRAPPQALSVKCFASLHVSMLEFAATRMFIYSYCTSFYMQQKISL